MSKSTEQAPLSQTYRGPRWPTRLRHKPCRPFGGRRNEAIVRKGLGRQIWHVLRESPSTLTKKLNYACILSTVSVFLFVALFFFFSLITITWELSVTFLCSSSYLFLVVIGLHFFYYALVNVPSFPGGWVHTRLICYLIPNRRMKRNRLLTVAYILLSASRSWQTT